MPAQTVRETPGGDNGASRSCLTIFAIVLCVLFFPIAVFAIVNIIPEYQRAVIFRLGRIKGKKAVGPGLFYIIPCTDDIIKVDMRAVSFDIPPQEILTKDSVTVAVDAVVYYRIQDPIKSVTEIEDSQQSTKLLAQTTLRNQLGMKTLSGILQDRDEISFNLLQTLDEATDPWGIKVERVELKDVRLPAQMQRSMAAEAEASRDAKAKIIAAQGEKDASLALREASDIINQSPGAIQLRYLQTLTTISAEKNSTIVFPLPIDLLTKMSGSK